MASAFFFSFEEQDTVRSNKYTYWSLAGFLKHSSLPLEIGKDKH